jgi:hypothetical protein
MKGPFSLKQLRILSQSMYAGHCESLGSNKDWAACLAVEVDDQDASPPNLNETTKVVYLSVHGPHGGNLIADSPKELTMKQALPHFTKKCREKDGKAYAHVPFAPYLPAFGRPFGLALVLPSLETPSVEESGPASSVAIIPAPALRYQACVVKAITNEQLHQFVHDSRYGVTEKVNGERCLLVFDSERLLAFNRKGQPMSAPPAGALHLRRLGVPFVIDGERLTGDLADFYVAFDLLEWDQKEFTATTYAARIMVLEHAMYQAGLLLEKRPTPSFAQAHVNSMQPGLALLTPASGEHDAQRAIEEIEVTAGEGIIVRRLEAGYAESPLKYKYVAELDAFGIAINEGAGGGSLRMGVVRTTDRAVIVVANVRAGLTEADLHTIQQMLEEGKRPVFTVRYLPKRSIGLLLVEPRTSMTWLRSDKEAVECTTEQFGLDKAVHIAHAKPVAGITLS